MSGGLDSTEKRVLQTLVDTSAELSTVWSTQHVIIIIHFLLKYIASTISSARLTLQSRIEILVKISLLNVP